MWVKGAMIASNVFPEVAKTYNGHGMVCYSRKEYVNPQGFHINTSKSFNATLERALIGVYH
jgi:hypothetical protein